MDALAGKLFGRYRLETLLGQGRLAAVYRAADPFGAEPVAVKVFDADLTADEAFGEAFLREIRGLTRLQHPGLLPVREVGEREDLIYLVMPLVKGGSLRDRLATPFDPAEAVALLRPVADALDYLHGQGLAHGDVRAENVLFAEDGAPLLADAGIAPAVERAAVRARGSPDGTLETSGAAAGGVPGPGLDQSPAVRTDLAAFAALLHEALTGAPPGADPAPAGIGPETQSALRRALAEAPADGYWSAGAMFDALSGALSGGGAGQSPSPDEPSAPSEGQTSADWPAPWTEPTSPPPPPPLIALPPPPAVPFGPTAPGAPAVGSSGEQPRAADRAEPGRSSSAPTPAAVERAPHPGPTVRWERRYSTKYDLAQLLRKAGPILLMVGFIAVWGGGFESLLLLVLLAAIGLAIYWWVVPYVEVVCGPNGFAVTTATRWHGGYTERYTWGDVRETRYFEETTLDDKRNPQTTHHFVAHTRRGDAFDLTTEPATYAHIIAAFNEMTPQLPYIWVPFTAVAGERVLQQRGAFCKVARQGAGGEGQADRAGSPADRLQVQRGGERQA